MWKISFTTVILAILLTVRLCNGDCNICNESNGAACVSNSTFQLCFNGIPRGSVYSCPNIGDVCTKLGLICADPGANSNIQADCGNTEQCGNCVGIPDGGYTCTSHTTFAMCRGEVVSSITGTCPSNDVCLTSHANDGVSPCVSQCLSNIQDMCDIESTTTSTVTPTNETPITGSPSSEIPSTETSITEVPITRSPSSQNPTTEIPTSEALTTEASTSKVPTTEATTTANPTTESSSSSSTGTTLSVEDAVCANQTLVGRYRNPNDATCRTYVYCSIDRTTRKLAGRLMTCTGSRFFNQSINNCQDALPTGCTQ